MDEYIFGANILENLTTGMYQDSKVSYREYIQNACDQIDKAVEMGILKSREDGQIEIWLSNDERCISIEDNATGIPQADFESTLANIADSNKRIGEDKGFRGIGRLCGLAYCRELVFSATAKGEDTISIMRCDAQKMRDYLARSVAGEKYTAGEVLKEIYQFEYKKKKSVRSEHWFKVELIDINDENTDLLDFDEVKEYLSFAAPVSYINTFSYQTEIYKHAKKIGYIIDEYNIKLNGEDVFKKYATHFKTRNGDDDVFEVEFKDFYDESGKLCFWLWYGVSNFKGVMKKECKMRGLRLRQANIQIGGEDALQKLFKEDRGQHYFIGELFAVTPELIPNSQRDYFNENPMRVRFELEVRSYFKEVFAKIYRGASEINSSFRAIDDYRKKEEEHQKKLKRNDYINPDDASKAQEAVESAKKKANEAQAKIDKYKQASDESEAGDVLGRMIQRIEKKRKEEDKPVSSADVKPVYTGPKPVSKKQPRWTDRLSRCNKKERILIEKIIVIIKRFTDEETVELIKKNIEEEFK